MVTTIYLSVNAALLSAIALLFKDVQMLEWGRQLSVSVLLIAGIAACDLWRKLIVQHSTLLQWWYEQLRALEETMPDSNRLLTKEYNDMYAPQRDKASIGLTRYEIGLTWLFTFVYAVFGLATMLILLIN